jgi:hypothetical protein
MEHFEDKENQKFLAKLTKNGMARKIKCVNDIFNVLCMKSSNCWIYRPCIFLYIIELVKIAENSRIIVKKSIEMLLNNITKDKSNYLFLFIEINNFIEKNKELLKIINNTNNDLVFTKYEFDKIIIEIICSDKIVKILDDISNLKNIIEIELNIKNSNILNKSNEINLFCQKITEIKQFNNSLVDIEILDKNKLISSIHTMVNIIFERDLPKLKYHEECICILFLFGLNLNYYFFNEFNL